MVSTTPFQFELNTANRPFAELQIQEKTHLMPMLLLCAGMGALLVVADQVINTLAEGHLFLGWVAMWVVAFAALCATAAPMQWAAKALTRWANAMQAQRIESQMWAFAQRDPRVMEELRMAMTRHRGDA
jgi:hypothetical protein